MFNKIDIEEVKQIALDASKKVYQYYNDESDVYNKENLLNSWFVVK